MNKQVALIRGINVGRSKRVAMADLRTLVTDLGYDDVKTLLNSGNVVFTVPNKSTGNAAARIEEGIEKKLGVSARVTVVTSIEFDRLVIENPLLSMADDHSRLFVAFLSNRADLDKLKTLTQQDWVPEQLALGHQAAYLWCPNGLLESKLPEAVGRLLGDRVTTRNWATVGKLHALLATKP